MPVAGTQEDLDFFISRHLVPLNKRRFLRLWEERLLHRVSDCNNAQHLQASQGLSLDTLSKWELS